MATDEILARIQDLEDRLEIKQLTARYAWHSARAEVKEMAALFTQDGCFESMSGVMRGAQAIHDFYKDHLQPNGTIPLVVNHIIDIDGNTARGTCNMSSPWQNSGPGFCGYYHDSYRRESNGWRFVYRLWTYHHQPMPK